MNKRVSHADVQRALDAFRAQGGLVQQLPPEKILPRRLVGRRHSQYEDPREELHHRG